MRTSAACGLFSAALLVLIGASPLTAQRGAAAPRPPGPCDIYAAAGTPCVAAHSTTRALYRAYEGPLYRVTRQSDGTSTDIGLMPSTGGYADAAAQDAFCAGTLCVISRIYDQSGKANHLYQAPAGPRFPGPAKGGFDTQPIADMAPVTIAGHKAYGVYVMPGMGFRNNDATDLAVDDEPEGIYYVIDGTHYDSGCCFDYGNSSTNGRAVGTGTMETTYFGTATAWGRGAGPGPWIMADMEAGLFSGYDAKVNAADPTIDSWRFLTAVVNGGGGNRWSLRGADAQQGALTTFYDGIRPGSRENASYYPMHKQGGLLLGTGGDNGNGSSGTFYEGVMTRGSPSDDTTDAVQANIVAARYDVARMGLSRMTTFTPGSRQEVTATFTNTTGAPTTDVHLSVVAPAGWAVDESGPVTFTDAVPPGAQVHATFTVTSPAAPGAGRLSARAEWTAGNARARQADTITARLRNADAIKINEVRFGADGNATDQFLELYNASDRTVDISNWTIVNTQSQWAPVTLATVPRGTTLARGAFYLLGLSSSGLAAPAQRGARIISVRTAAGLSAGDTIDVDGETHTVASLGTAATTATTVFVPVSTGPWITIPAGSTSLPVTNAAGFVAGKKIGIDIGGRYEEATVTAVGTPATQTTLASTAVAGSAAITIAAAADVRARDTLTIGTGSRKELVKIASVGASVAGGTVVTLSAPLTFSHRGGVDVSDPGTGIRFSPATAFAHESGDAMQALGSGITLNRPLARDHSFGAPVVNSRDATAGYQGPPAPNQWFGGPLSARAGSIVLLDATGAVAVDAIVYGSQQSSSSANGTITSPEIATLEGDQGRGGCIAVVPSAGRGRAGAAPAPVTRSVGRVPDGADTDSNCADFVAAVPLNGDAPTPGRPNKYARRGRLD